MTQPFGTLRAMMLALALVGILEQDTGAAPRRPSQSSSACNISADKFNELAAKNPQAAQGCRSMADDAARTGQSFAFMCDAATGQVSCCNSGTCIPLGSMIRRLPPGASRGNVPPLQQTPNQPVKPGMAPPAGQAR